MFINVNKKKKRMMIGVLTMSNNSAHVMSLVTEFMPILQKYSGIQVEKLDISVTKYDNGTVMKFESPDQAIGDFLTDMMIMVSKMAQTSEGKVSIEVDDKRG